MAFTLFGVIYSKTKDVKLNQLNEFLKKGWKPIAFRYTPSNCSSMIATIAKPKA